MRKKFFYVSRSENGVISLCEIQGANYKDVIEELKVNNVRVLFLCSYYSGVSRYLFKYISLLLSTKQEELSQGQEQYNNWTIQKPYLYFNQRNGSYEVSEQMIFGNYDYQFVGYVPDKFFQELLIKNDM